MELDNISLGIIANGYVDEVFQRELKGIIENIIDPNTDPEKAREIVLKIKIKPNKDRNRADILVSTSTKVCPPAPMDTILYFGKRSGKVVAEEHNPQQLDIPGTRPIMPDMAWEETHETDGQANT